MIFVARGCTARYKILVANTSKTPSAPTHYLSCGWREVSFTASKGRMTIVSMDRDDYTTPIPLARAHYALLVSEGFTPGRLARRAA